MERVERKSGGIQKSVVGVAAAAVLLMSCVPLKLLAQQAGQKTFSSCHMAGKALVAALKNNDEKALLEILGPAGKEIISSGDPTQDADNRADLVKRYDEMHRMVKEPDGTTTLYLGAENWPMPIPLVEKSGSWYFDTEAGKREILYRRVGRNEISTIRVLKELVAAEKDYNSSHHEYAQKITSAPGEQDGLYWQTSQGQPQSPIGPLVAAAVAEGYRPTSDGEPQSPYRGYYYHVLTRQGASAPGGAKSYIENGKMTGGFAFVAYPAEYRSSGVMTFIVDRAGVVYRRDLGPNTTTIAKAMKAYNRDTTWSKDEDQQEESASDQRP